MSQCAKALMFVIGLIYVTINAILLSGGIFDYSHYHYQCEAPLARIDIVMPGHKLGCWLAKPLVNPDGLPE